MTSAQPQVIERSDEDRIIENIVIEGSKKLYEDLDFLPTRQSLYISDKHIPDYDENVFHKVIWCRPQEIYPNATYFDPNTRNLFIQKGTLPNELFLNAIMALCTFPRFDFLENIFISDPNNLLQFGVYTCRFYVDGDWVEVVTDSLLPCVRVKGGASEDSPVQPGDAQLLYGRSLLINEMWVSLLEKAFAKAVGSYEAISSMKLQKILLHLTGGSVQYVSLRDEVMKWDSQATNIGSSSSSATAAASNRSDEGLAWKEFKKLIKKDAITMLLPDDSKYQDAATDGTEPQTDNNDGGDQERVDSNYFIPNTLYTVVSYKEINGYELVLLHCPWQANPYYSTDPRVQASNPSTAHYYYEWTGEWSDSSNDWDIYPEILIEIERDPSIPWRRGVKEGYFWISFRSLIKYFNMRYTCHVFPTSLGYNFYCVKGECRGQQAAGPLYTLRDRETVIKEAQQSKSNAIVKRTCSVVIDGDPSFFNNPQYRISLNSSSTSSATLYVSLIPIANVQDGETEPPQMSVSVLSSHKHFTFTPNTKSHSPTPILGSHSLWDVSQYEVVSTDRTNKSVQNIKGQEVSIWSIPITAKNYYHIVPYLLKKNKENDFILRIFSTQPINVEILPPLLMTKLHGEWKKTSDNDSTGGPLIITSNNKLKENNKWGQNPQYHLQLVNPYNKDDLFLKIVLRKVDAVRRGSKTGSKLTSSSKKPASSVNTDDKRLNATVGLIICKADILEDMPKKKKNEPRQNKFGEPIPPKESSLKKKPSYDTPDSQIITPNSQQSHKTILRKLHLPIPPNIISPPQALSKNKTDSNPPNPASLPNVPTSLASFSTLANLNSTYITTSFTDKNEATIFFPYLPRTWLNTNGILIIPCMSEKNIRSDFELEVYSSELITLQALPENCTRTLISEWTEATAGGSKLFESTWKKNPKFSVRMTSRALAEAQNSSRTEFMWRITLKKIGNTWDKGKHDIVGNMIGIYIFHVNGTEQNLIHQTDFVPGNSDAECVTEGLFLPALQNSSEYFIIMPTTFNDKIVGPFALSIISECDFHLKKES